MSNKSIIIIGMVVGSIIGGYLPTLFGVSMISFTSIITAANGGFIGVAITYKLVS